jgi:hypothetical protein
MRDLLFVYGTLCDAEIFGAVTGRPFASFSVRPYRLAGFRAARSPSTPFPLLMSAGGASVSGLLIGRLDRTSLARLKYYEGSGYRLTRLRRLPEGRWVTAFVSVNRADALAADWRLADWQRLHKADFLPLLRRRLVLIGARKP